MRLIEEDFSEHIEEIIRPNSENQVHPTIYGTDPKFY